MKLYSALVVTKHLKGWEKILAEKDGGRSDGRSDEPFTVDGLNKRLVAWIVADDQASYLTFRVHPLLILRM